MSQSKESNLVGMPELIEFDTSYSAFGGWVLLDATFRDTMAQVMNEPDKLTDMRICVSSDVARELAARLIQCAEMIDAGLSSPSIKFFDD